MADLIQIAAVWKQNKNGKDYYTGKLGDSSIFIFENLDKLKPGANPKLPDWKIFVGRNNEKKKTAGKGVEAKTYQNESLAEENEGYIDYKHVDLNEDDIPF